MIIKVLVKPGRREQKILLKEGVYFVTLKSKAVKGKANKELIKLLRTYFKKQPRIVSGAASRKKLVELL
jgi:uncharacterized protein (TIGR00251 family)